MSDGNRDSVSGMGPVRHKLVELVQARPPTQTPTHQAHNPGPRPIKAKTPHI